MCRHFILVICGPPCSGKSELLKCLSAARGDFRCFEMDTVRKTILPGPLNGKPLRNAAYRVMHFQGARELLKERSVVFSATYMPKEHRAEVAAMAARLNVPLYVVQCICPTNVALQRFSHRDLAEHAATDLTTEKVRRLVERYKPFDEAVLLDSSRCSDLLESTLQYVEKCCGVDPIRWANHSYQPDPGEEGHSGSSKIVPDPLKLSGSSPSKARTRLNVYKLGTFVIIVLGLLGAQPIFPMLAGIFPATHRLWNVFLVSLVAWDEYLRSLGPVRWVVLFLLALSLGLSLKGGATVAIKFWNLLIRLVNGMNAWVKVAFLTLASSMAIAVYWSLLHALNIFFAGDELLIKWLAWGTFLFAGGSIYIIFDAYRSLRTESVVKEQEVVEAMETSRYSANEVRPTDVEVFHAYRWRLKSEEISRMPMPGVPIYFLIPPAKAISFCTLAQKQKDSGSVLTSEAAAVGLDWNGFLKWRTRAVQKRYYQGSSNEVGLRCLALNEQQRRTGVCTVVCAASRYSDYLCREHVVNLVAPGILPDMRRLFEGHDWDAGELSLREPSHCSKRYSMHISVTGLLMSADGYFILQRRSGHVGHGIGSMAGSLNGAVQDGESNLRDAALRELWEETGIKREDISVDTVGNLACGVPGFDIPFLAAAYNLRYGRDLNFYCCFKTKLTASQITLQPTRPRDAWELDHLVFLHCSQVSVSIIEAGGLDRLLPERGRHLLGALYAWAVYAGGGGILPAQGNSLLQK